ncbi:MAG: universal stress protein [Blastocatellia bacterium]|nr:universal stress protein [Blastocatellia bacterium]MBO0800739.1 universal stress protein [Blastocatellia bacterium]
MQFKDVLVPVDFSPGSLRAIEFAFSLIDPEGEVCLLHVIDAGFVAKLSEEGFLESEAALEKLRKRSEERLTEIAKRNPSETIQVDTMVVVGTPFAEILRVANDLYFEMIVLSIRGRQQGSIEDLLFGSTAEKVLRGARIPVFCVPVAGV